ncbi:MAG: AbrB/MazE/SpoVT family DNA-binding domain-containing protein [Hoeflea sp.]|uniref:AbrB/MazE/SpoVT family DNA-binding domain-containing protein n=1 Tax=Hoeflea sp. TaxID=1940281 RepID=UPI00272FDE2C|nr:AbrB/MazE/SpoVT family DNA-binding domain-containing protein [Hoeflea sp.]MDP2118364.1 AbrB/MazE/SpoVT family DNA-binding domain-containing protein [Hoeflea sp.]
MSIFDPPRISSSSEFERVDMPFFKLAVDEEGRVTIPADLLSPLLVEPGRPLIAEVVDGELRMISPKAAIRKVRRLVSEQDWGTVFASDELIFERRAEALREYAESMLPTYEW